MSSSTCNNNVENSSKFIVVTTTSTGEIITNERNEICLASKADGNLYFTTPTEDVLKAFGISVSQVPVSLEEKNENTSCEDNVNNNNNTKHIKWCRSSILELINLRIELDSDFKSTSVKNDIVWKKVSNELHKRGYAMTPTQCNDKWRYLKSKYTAKKDNIGSRGTGEAPMDFEFFNIMDDFLSKKHNIRPPVIASSVKGDTLPNTHDEEIVDVEEPLAKKSKITSAVKQNKPGFHKLLETIMTASERRESHRERRHQEMLAAKNKAVDVFSEKMDQLLDKMSK